MALYLLCFGFMTYYIIPYAFLFNEYGIVFFVMNFILQIKVIGMSLLCSLILPRLSIGTLHVLMCCRKKD